MSRAEATFIITIALLAMVINGVISMILLDEIKDLLIEMRDYQYLQPPTQGEVS